MTDHNNQHTLENAFFYEGEKTTIFIDGSNIYSCFKHLDFLADYRLLRDVLRDVCYLQRMFYYTATKPDTEDDPLKKLLDYLSYNGYILRTKPARKITYGDNNVSWKGNMDVEMVIDALQMAPNMDHAIIASGDGDFCELVKALQLAGVRVTIMSTMGMLSDALRRSADSFIELETLRNRIERKL